MEISGNTNATLDYTEARPEIIRAIPCAKFETAQTHGSLCDRYSAELTRKTIPVEFPSIEVALLRQCH